MRSSVGQGRNGHDPSSLSLEEDAFSRAQANRLVGAKLKSRVRIEGISPGGRFARIRELPLAPEDCPGERLDSLWISQEEELRQRVGVNLAKKKKNVPRAHQSRNSDVGSPLVAYFN